MTQPSAPMPPKPEQSEIHAVAGPTIKRRAVITTIISALTGLPSLLSALKAVPGLALPQWLEVTLGTIAVVTMWLTPILNSMDSADSAARASRMGPGAGSGG